MCDSSWGDPNELHIQIQELTNRLTSFGLAMQSLDEALHWTGIEELTNRLTSFRSAKQNLDEVLHLAEIQEPTD